MRDDVRWGAGGDHGEDLGEVRTPVLALDSHDPHRDVGMQLLEAVDEALALHCVLSGPEDRDGQCILPATWDITRRQARPGHRRSDDAEPDGREHRPPCEVSHFVAPYLAKSVMAQFRLHREPIKDWFECAHRMLLFE
jgi:hypothetical protein